MAERIMKNSSGAVFTRLVGLTADAYRPAGRTPYFFARGKLGGDPVFAAMLREGMLRSGDRLLDLGCGQGVLEALLATIDTPAAAGCWPADWARPPRGISGEAFDLRADAIAAGEVALRHSGASDRFALRCEDIRNVSPKACSVVTILDVLHYIPHEDQEAVLTNAIAALEPGGRLLLRVGDAARGWRFRYTLANDWLITRLRGGRGRFWSRSAAQWVSLLTRLGLEVEAPRDMSEGTLFANVLLRGHRV
ncbi:MAG: class I SAM-dependent methyltransferase [Burkholderiaceae bacterium]|nr:class I SAM-dependent methyltransferase [Burkholderiaceae bacterium]